MWEPAIHVLRLVFTRLVRQNAFAIVATLRVLFFLPIHQRLILIAITQDSAITQFRLKNLQEGFA